MEGLEQHGTLANLRGLQAQLLSALDGTPSFSSHTLYCQHWLRRQTSKGHTRYDHTAIPPVLVCPGRSEVLAFPPEYIMPQDGHDKQDWERVAGPRWRVQHARSLAPHGVTFLGDYRYSHQPLGKWGLQPGRNFLFVCPPASHVTLYARVAFWQATDGIKARESRHWNGRFTAVTMLRSINDVFLRGGRGALSVNWLEMTGVNSNPGAPLSPNNFITNPPLTEQSVSPVAQAGRGRWKIENENHPVRTTKGSHLEHHCGHGKQYLAAFLLRLTLLAFLAPTVLAWCDESYAVRRQTLQPSDMLRCYPRSDALYGV